MSSLMPVLVIILALIAAGSIAYIAWELSSDKFHDSISQRPSQQPKDSDDDA